jgi:alpha-maltose-1-phosphate synthase
LKRGKVSKIVAALISREYPPDVYGGAGVHVEYLARELRRSVELCVHCFGEPRSEPNVQAHPAWQVLDGTRPHLAALRTLSTDLAIARAAEGAQIVHSHTWYANFAGHLSKLLYGIPHVMTSHSLEPLRPWKAEQLGGGYALSCFCEKTAIEAADAVIAVSRGMRADILRAYPSVDPERVHVIYNGIDPEEYRADPAGHVLARHGIDPSRPFAVFVGRITRQKGVTHLLRAMLRLPAEVGLVLCAGEPDTPEIAAEVRALVGEIEASRGGLIWIERMLPRPELIQILSHARVFACPSVYEPFGIVNLEAMACGVPVVASAVGGIPEVVVDGETGLLVSFEAAAGASAGPADPEQFAADFAAAIGRVSLDPALGKKMGSAGRRRVLEHFSWRQIAEQTAELYARLVAGARL